jgi:hypothetical protein
MIQHALRQAAYLDVAKHFYKIWEMPSTQEDQDGAAVQVSAAPLQFLGRACLYIMSGIGAYRLLLDTGTSRQRTIRYDQSSICRSRAEQAETRGSLVSLEAQVVEFF